MPAESTTISPSLETTPFNFSRASMVAHDQLRTLRTLDEQFARNLTHTLGAWLRTTITVTPMVPEQSVFSEFADKTAVGSYVVPLTVQPLQVRAAMSCDLALAPPIIDLLLGGSGRSVSFDRDLTEIEDAVLASVLDLVLREWDVAWQPFGMELTAGTRERGGHGQRLMPLQERTYCSRLQISLADTVGELLFCMPSAAIASALRVFAQRRDRQRQRLPEERQRMVRRLGAASFHASLHFPAMQMPAETLQQLSAGTLLPLPLARGATADVRVGGVALFQAKVVRVGERRAAQITSSLHGTVPERATA